MSEAGPGSVDEDREQRVVAEAFAAFRAANHDAFTPPPVEWVYATADRRQRLNRQRGWLATAAAVLPAMLLLLGSTTLLSMAGGDDPRPGGDRAATVDATPPVSARPSGTKSSEPGTDPRTRGPSRPRGGIPIDLANATIDLPAAAGCPGGVLSFVAGRATDPGGCDWQLGAWRAHYANLDGVPGQEIATRFTVGATSGVVALRPATGRVVGSMGYVMTADLPESVGWVAVSNGVVTVGVTGGADTDASGPARSYRWDPAAGAFLLVDSAPQAPTTPPPPLPSAEPDPSTLEPSLPASATP